MSFANIINKEAYKNVFTIEAIFCARQTSEFSHAPLRIY